MEDRLKQVFGSAVRVEPEAVHDALTPRDLAGWDSLRHLNLVVTLEETFGVAFTVEEMTQMFSSFGAVRSAVMQKVRGE